MNSAAVRSRMTQRALVERDQNLGDGRYAVPDFQTHIASQPCFLWTKSGVESVSPERTAVVEQVKVLMPLGTDVKSTDRINGISDRQGSPVLAGFLNVMSVLPHHSHLELEVMRVKGGA